MGSLITALIAALPSLLPMIIALFNKGKTERIQYFENLKKAALHDQKALLAFTADSILCWVKDAPEEEWKAVGDSLNTLCDAAAKFTAAKKAGAT